jgi:hypothetical protein
LQTQIFNQLAQLVTNGTAKVRLLKEDDTASESPATKGTVALVIGGSGGIGRAVCSGLAASSFDVAVHYFSNKGDYRLLPSMKPPPESDWQAPARESRSRRWYMRGVNFQRGLGKTCQSVGMAGLEKPTTSWPRRSGCRRSC